MALTVERRNEIAWLFFLHYLQNRGKLHSVQETCNYFSKEYKIPNDEVLHMTVENAHWEILFPNCPKSDGSMPVRYELVWLLHILYEFKKGVKIGESFNRDIGNKAGEIEMVGINEVWEYYSELIAVIANLLSKNRWWQTFENPSQHLEYIKRIAVETRKVKSAEAVS